MRMEVPKEAFESGLLVETYHHRLLLDLPSVTSVAGIPQQFVWSKLSEYCTEDELTWVRCLKLNNDFGLVYTGNFEVPVADKMMAMVGMCLRNYVDARFMTLQQVVAFLKTNTMPNPTVLMVPNFCMGESGIDDIPKWEVSALLGLLYSRLAKNLKTVLYVGSISAVEKQYGVAFKQHLLTHYTIL